MQLSDFDFSLPSELIAQNPASPRDQARLLVYDRASNTFEHSTIAEIGNFLPKKSILVANNSRVRQGRLFGTSQNKPIEILVLEKVEENLYRCLVKGRHPKTQDQLQFFENKSLEKTISLSATIETIEVDPGMNTYLLRFVSSEDCETIFARFGTTPLPPYITQSSTQSERYQTVFSKDVGSAAAPTAGLHFTPELIEKLVTSGINWEEVTLQVGIGTFLPLRNNEVIENRLHKETTYVSPETASTLTTALQTQTPITAIGTTSARTLEAHAQKDSISAGWLDTNLFIYPGYQFKVINQLLTNFHLPKSSLLVLVAALLGNDPTTREIVKSEAEMIETLQYIYQTAIQHEYRFYSFGDALLIL